jgi:indole-3-glycerol phosphate synthase
VLREFVEYARLSQIEPIIEVDNEDDLVEILGIYKPMEICIGINARDLSTLTLDRTLHFSLAEKYKKELSPFIVFAFSGIEKAEYVSEYREKYNGVLIGSLFRT